MRNSYILVGKYVRRDGIPAVSVCLSAQYRKPASARLIPTRCGQTQHQMIRAAAVFIFITADLTWSDLTNVALRNFICDS
jgi:hypothetical protein